MDQIASLVREMETDDWEVVKDNGREASFRRDLGSGTCVINISQDRDTLRIDLIKARPIGQGAGSEGLASLLECAERAGADLSLDVRPQPGGLLGETELMSWYERHGFEDDPCSNAFGMIRYARSMSPEWA